LPQIAAYGAGLRRHYITFGKLPFGNCTSSTIGKLPLGKLSLEKLPWGENAFEKLPNTVFTHLIECLESMESP